MPKNTNILLIRHAEKPDAGTGLSETGQERAQAYAVYFQQHSINGNPVKLSYLFCAADSDSSHRPRLTIEPLAKATGLDINDKHPDKDYAKLAQDILQHSKYDNTDLLICWHHEEILALAAALGVNPAVLPPASNWPVSWPGRAFGWLLQICFDGIGNIAASQTLCTSQQLMYGDYGQNPPAKEGNSL